MDIKYKGLELEVEYVYEPEEEQTLEHPGYEENVVIESIWWDGMELLSLFSHLDLLEDLETLILKERKNN